MEVPTGGRNFRGTAPPTWPFQLLCLHCGLRPLCDLVNFDIRVVIVWQLPPLFHLCQKKKKTLQKRGRWTWWISSGCRNSDLCVRTHGGGCYKLRENRCLLGQFCSSARLHVTSCSALGSVDQCWVNLKPHPGVFRGWSKYWPRSMDLVITVHVNCSSVESRALETRTTTLIP